MIDRIKKAPFRYGIIGIALLIFCMTKITMSVQLNKAFEEFHSMNLTGVVVTRTSISSQEQYSFVEEAKLHEIKEYIYNLKKHPVRVKDHVVYNGRFDHYLSFADDQNTSYFTYVYFLGEEYIEIRLYNSELMTYDRFRARIDLTEEDIAELLKNERKLK